jgi:hypothetical protein
VICSIWDTYYKEVDVYNENVKRKRKESDSSQEMTFMEEIVVDPSMKALRDLEKGLKGV